MMNMFLTEKYDDFVIKYFRDAEFIGDICLNRSFPVSSEIRYFVRISKTGVNTFKYDEIINQKYHVSKKIINIDIKYSKDAEFIGDICFRRSFPVSSEIWYFVRISKTGVNTFKYDEIIN